MSAQGKSLIDRAYEMLKPSEEEILERVAWRFELFCKKSGLDMGMDRAVPINEFSQSVWRSFKFRKAILKDINREPAAVEKDIDKALEHLHKSIKQLDELPFTARQILDWGRGEEYISDPFEQAEHDRKLAKVFEENPSLTRPQPTPLQNAKYDLQQAFDLLRKARTEAIPAIRQLRLQRWHRPDVIALMWAIDATCHRMRFFDECPMKIDTPKTIKTETFFSALVEEVVAAYGLRTSNLERNWEYMVEVKTRYDLLHKFQVSAKALIRQHQ